jgi:preprotein translocase subunit SecA
VDEKNRTVMLTDEGVMRVEQLLDVDNLFDPANIQAQHHTMQALKAHHIFKRDVDYIVSEDQVVIVDEFTGRLGEGRKWRDGIHQAVEAKEGVKVTWATGQAARVTVQDYFLRFEHLAGMTGTAAASARELRSIYRCHVIPVPTNKPPQRKRWTTLIYREEDAKWDAIVQEIININKTGRPILIGTRTIDKSILLSEKLQRAGVTHSVLNAYKIAEEAEIVAKAGEFGKVTVSTNMAGRGTDIKITDEVRELGGLFVICTEMHESARIDRQLIGRCGRQGDPGSFRQYLSLGDELLKKAYGKKRKFIAMYEGLFIRAQRKVEKKSYRNRKVMLYYEKERKKMQRAMGQDPYLDAPN